MRRDDLISLLMTDWGLVLLVGCVLALFGVWWLYLERRFAVPADDGEDAED